MKEKLKELGYWLGDKLKDLCGEITPDKRLTVILIILLIFTILNLYFTFTSISTWGWKQEQKELLKIEYMKRLDLEKVKPKKLDFDFLDSEPDIEMSDSINFEKNRIIWLINQN